MLYKKQIIPSELGFSNFPENFYSNLPVTVSIFVQGYGLVTGTTGIRWWDSSVLTSNGQVILPAAGTLTLPFTKNFLNPGFLVDLFVSVKLNGTEYWYAASNSPDNQTVTSSAQERKLFYLPLYCFGYGLTLGNSNTNNNFMQGGEPRTTGNPLLVPVYFLEPTVASGTITVKLVFMAYSATVPAGVFTKTVSYNPGVTTVDLFSIVEIRAFYNSLGYYLIEDKGFYKIEVICSDTSYTSMLNFYHWGQSN